MKLLSTTGYRPRLNTVYLCFTSSHGWPVYHDGKMVHLHFPPYKAVAPASPFFPLKATKHLPKNATFSTNGSTSQKTEPAIVL